MSESLRLYSFDITVKSSGKILRQIYGSGESRAEARKSIIRLFRDQYDLSCVSLEN